MQRPAALLLCLAGTLAAAPAPAAPPARAEMFVYHCQSPGGGTSVQQTPCATGVQKAVRLPPRKTNRVRPACITGPRGGTYTLTPSGRKNYAGC